MNMIEDAKIHLRVVMSVHILRKTHFTFTVWLISRCCFAVNVKEMYQNEKCFTKMSQSERVLCSREISSWWSEKEL